jgi:hypothetical protein
MIVLPEFGEAELLAPPTTPRPQPNYPLGNAAWVVGLGARAGGRRKPQCQLRRTMH